MISIFFFFFRAQKDTGIASHFFLLHNLRKVNRSLKVKKDPFNKNADP